MTESHQLGRRELLATIAGTSVASGSLVGGALATFNDTETTSATLTSGSWGADSRIAYTDSSTLHSITQPANPTDYGVSGVGVLGPVTTAFAGGTYQIPVVDDTKTLLLVAPDGSRTTLDVGSQPQPRASKAMLATAAWNTQSQAVYYAGTNSSRLCRVAPGSTAEAIANPGNGVKAAVGAGDINNDGTAEFVFVDGSATVRYILPGDSTSEHTITSTSISPGSNNNFGVGPPASIEGYGTVIPAVNGSGGLGLLGPNGWVEKSLTPDSTAAKTTVAPRDFDGDGAIEIAFVGYTNNSLQYLDDIGNTNDTTMITTSEGNPITVDTSRGVL